MKETKTFLHYSFSSKDTHFSDNIQPLEKMIPQDNDLCTLIYHLLEIQLDLQKYNDSQDEKLWLQTIH